MVSLMNDSRVVFLIWFILVAIVVAALLIFVEIRLKKKKILAAEKKRVKTPIDRMKIALSRGGTPRDNLDLVGATAKSHFKEAFGLSTKLDYGELAKEFKRRGSKLEVKFCEGMFEAYYSQNELTKEKIWELSSLLEEAYRKKTVAVKVSTAPGVWDKVDKFFEEWWGALAKRVNDYVALRNEKLNRAARITARQEYELSSWVRKAIRLGHDREKVAGLLNDGERSKDEIKKILNIYDKEADKISREKNGVSLYGGSGGIAQRIVQEGKDLMDNPEAYVR